MRILSVSEFLTGVNEALSGVPALVEGEVSGFSVRQEQWVFFSLKDERSVVECFMPFWKLRHEIEDGMLVRIAGVPRVYEKTGRFRITVERLEPAGDGMLRRAFELLQQKLAVEGLFAPERKRALPRFPETIGLITSTEAAAYTDFLRILENRWGGVTVFVQDVRVQGDGAVEDICSAFARWKRVPSADLPDVLVLTRGGGSLEDLQAFNSEMVARAIFASPVPVVVGVGHERDVTIADLVADVRASTPSNAAERVVPDRREIARAIAGAGDRIAERMEQWVGGGRVLVARFLACGTGVVARRRSRLAACTRMVSVRVRSVVQASRVRIVSFVRVLEATNPERLLRRGFSMTFSAGRIVRVATDLHAGNVLTTKFSRGSVTSTVTDVTTT